ncbi:hypothetical protein EHN07_06430 [Buttiauxella warmboldiae]|uniref:Uncharacterized protein n=1 Tax=Buttiauxella warmboldiae TaxID=82993 RepID=A0A3N5DPY6_9ENTR|nr:hypothetical protein EHN07_06430 [Buttiauxella warmboldiae]
MSNGKTKTQAGRLFVVNFDATGITLLSIDWRCIDRYLCVSVAVTSNRTLAVISPQKTLHLCCHHSRLFWNTSESYLFSS